MLIAWENLSFKVSARLEELRVRLFIGLHKRSRKGAILNKPCASLEDLAAYVDHNISEEEKAWLESHMTDCERCRKIVLMVYRSQQAVPDPKPLERENR